MCYAAADNLNYNYMQMTNYANLVMKSYNNF